MSEKNTEFRRVRKKLEVLDSEAVGWVIHDVLKKTHSVSVSEEWAEHVIKLIKDDYNRLLDNEAPKGLQQKSLFD